MQSIETQIQYKYNSYKYNTYYYVIYILLDKAV